MADKKQQWIPNTSREQGKLAPKEADWNLPVATMATRTRHGGHGRPVLSSGRDNSPPSTSSDGSFDSDDTGGSMSGDNVLSDVDDEEKPAATRVIVEVEQVKTTLEEFSLCKNCQGPMEATLQAKGFGLATKIEMKCLDRNCSFVHHSKEPAKTKIHDDRYDRLTDYAVNCLYVLAFLSVGDGPAEVEKLLGLLGMPNDTSMGSTTFRRIENRIEPFIRDLADAVLLENCRKEVRYIKEGP